MPISHANIQGKSTFLTKIALLDYDKYYNPKIRVTCHIFIWVLFTSLIFFNLMFDYGLSYDISLLFSLRSLTCNALVFYISFYIITPYVLQKKRFFLTILFIPILIIIWLIINHYFFIIIYNSKPKIVVESVRKSVKYGAAQSIRSLLSIKYILSMSIVVLNSVAPFFFIKVLFDITKFYSAAFRSERVKSQLEIEKLNLESDFLKAQLNPHFLFNTLNNLYGLILKNNKNSADVILHLSNIMRYTLYESNTERVLLKKELEFIKGYVQLEKLRYNKNKEITLDIDESGILGIKTAPLITFVFIENAFKYGLKSSKHAFIEIRISVRNGIFNFSISNDKEGFDSAITTKRTGGIGIENVKRRLDLIYADKYNLDVNDSSNSFSVNLKINME